MRPLPDEPGEADDLAGPDVERDVLERRRPREPAHGEHDRCVARRRRLRREDEVDRAPEHRGDERVRRLRRAAGVVWTCRPSLSTVTVSASASTSSRSARRRRSSRRRRAGRAMISSRRSASSRESDAVGSSITISRASRTSARRISTFCCSATRSVADRACRVDARSRSRSASSRKRSRCCERSTTPTAPSSTPRNTLSSDRQRRHQRQLLVNRARSPCGDRVARRAVADRLARRRRSRRCPACTTPAMILPSVDLPAPFSPTSAWISPAAIATLTSASARAPP